MRSTTRMRLEDCAAVATGRIRFYVATKGGNRVPALGRVVNVAPHITCTTFAAHEALEAPGWCVSCIRSGGRAGYGESEAQAIANAHLTLGERTDADMARAMRRIEQMLVGEGV